MVYMHANVSLLKKLDSIYKTAIRFVTKTPSCSHPCILYKMVGWSSLYQRRKIHVLLFTAKALLGKLPTYICNLLSYYTCNYSTRNSYKLHLTIPIVCSEFGKTVFSSYGPRLWNEMQSVMMLETIPSLNICRNPLDKYLEETCNFLI